MKSLSNRCEHWQESICLMASGALAGQEKAEIENHLATCPNCREVFAEMAKVSAPLANWERNYDHVEPSQAAQLRWAKVIQQASETQPLQTNRLKFCLNLLWRELIWPCRRTWAGLATVWLTILVFNHSQAQRSHAAIAKSTTPPGEMRVALQEQRRVLEEIIDPPLRAAIVEPPRRPNIQPRSQLRSVRVA